MTDQTRLIGRLAFALIVAATMVTICSIDLLLPAVPDFPNIFNTTMSMSQLTVATYTFGAALGYPVFGTLAMHMNRARLLYVSFALFGIISLACAYVTDIYTLTGLRALQGFTSAGAGVFAPAMINAIFDERTAMRAMTLTGSIQALAPGLAPIAGLWLLANYGWTSSFFVVTALSLPIAFMFFMLGKRLPMGKPPVHQEGSHYGYLALLKNREFWRFGMSRSLVLGGIVAFMLSAPNVFINVLDFTMRDFIIVQASGIFAFFIVTNTASQLDRFFKLENIILFGWALGTTSSVVFFTYVFFGGGAFWAIWLTCILMNIGFGCAGNISFFLAIKSAKGDDTRASALAVLWLLLCIAGGTAITAPFLTFGLISMATIAVIMHLAGILVFFLRKPHA